MKIPFYYNLMNLWRRKLTTSITILGITLVVFSFTAVLMLAHGLEETLAETGSEQNVIILRKGADTEVLSWIMREAGNIIKTFPEIASLPDGSPLYTTDLSVIINLKKKISNDMGNIAVRGTTHRTFLLRPYINIIAGRKFKEGTTEIIVGKSIHKSFQECNIGNKLKFGNQQWQIVGIFDTDGKAFDSEIWGDVNEMMPAFKRPVYSTMLFRLKNKNDFRLIKKKLENDPRLNQLVAKIEKNYYFEQSAFMATFIRIVGLVITLTFSIGSIIGAMITMYTSVTNRKKEIGTLRALGFRRRNILISFLTESLIISILGGFIGLFLATFLQFYTFSTTNFASFTEMAFDFKLSTSIGSYSMLFAIFMGLLGGFFPSIRASRMEIVDSLRAI